MVEITKVNEDGIWFEVCGQEYVGRPVPKYGLTMFIDVDELDIITYAPGDPESFTEAELRQVFDTIITGEEARQ